MQEFEEIQAMWQKQEIDIKLTAEEMLNQAKKELYGIKRKSMLNIIGMMVCLLLVACVPVFFSFNSPTTYLGIGLFLLAILVVIILLIANYRVIAHEDPTQHPRAFLAQLKRYQLNKYYQYRQLYWFYTGTILTGFILYFFETFTYLTVWMQIVIAITTALWILYCVTILRKSIMNKEKKRVDLLTKKFENISSQFERDQCENTD